MAAPAAPSTPFQLRAYRLEKLKWLQIINFLFEPVFPVRASLEFVLIYLANVWRMAHCRTALPITFAQQKSGPWVIRIRRRASAETAESRRCHRADGRQSVAKGDPPSGGRMTTLNINGRDHSVDVPGDTPLLWVIREHLQMTGTKFGCGAGLCGACTVHLNGEAVRSCQTAVSNAAGKKIVTIEGLDPKGEHPLQRAWIAEQVPQCGYCQSGQIMSAAALLAVNANPSDGDIDDAMAGNLCRCGTYTRIRRAIHLAAEIARGQK